MYKIKINRKRQTIKIQHVSRRVIIRSKSKRGLPGAGADKNFVQAFTNSSLVTVNHALNKRPAVSIEDSAGDEVEGDVQYININTIIVRFSSSFTGKIICN